jgi:hypothetical protein
MSSDPEAYEPATFEQVVVLEFYMPLTQEAALRRTLDSLFYEDAVLRRLHQIDPALLESMFGGPSAITSARRFVDERFRGYSIYRVDGRFRSRALMTLKRAAEIASDDTYLADETTAVCRFVFPCRDGDAAKIRLLFDELFVAALTEQVKGEQEIWVIESGLRNQIRIWKRKE